MVFKAFSVELDEMFINYDLVAQYRHELPSIPVQKL